MNTTDPQLESRRFQKRSLFCAGIVLALFFIFFARLVYLQIFKHTFYATLSQKNIISVIPIEPDRGLIYDRNGVLLAKNDSVYSLMLIPGRIHHIKETIQALTPIADLTPDDIKSFYYAMKQYYPYQPVPLKKQITEKEADQFYVNQYRFPGAVIQKSTVRYYPLGAALGNVVGYVGRINPKELANIDAANYTASDDIGKAGVERENETLLHGQTGSEEAEIDANGKVVRILKETPSTPGDNVYLTVDSQLQTYIEKIMGDNAGAVVAIQPQTGQVLAIVTNPSYDPNKFVRGMSTAEYQTLLNAKNHPLFNRATRGLFAPGSTVKPFIAFYTLNNHLIDIKDYIFDPGWYQLPNTTHVFHDWKKGGHGWVNIYKAIYMSCDTFFYQLAANLGIDRLDQALGNFGFGQETGINLPEERTGVVSSPNWKMGHVGVPWYGGDTVMSGIGQDYTLVTPLQLATATATMANRGQRFVPNVLLEIRHADGTEENMHSTESTPVATNDPAAWNVVISAMQQVVQNNDGTAHYGFGANTPYTVAAKTGTAQVHGEKRNDQDKVENLPKQFRDNHWFIAFAPVDHPQIAVAIIVEHSPEAVSVGRKILDFYFNELKTNAAKETQVNAQAAPIPLPATTTVQNPPPPVGGKPKTPVTLPAAQSTIALPASPVATPAPVKIAPPENTNAPAPTAPAIPAPNSDDVIADSNAQTLQQEMDSRLDMQMQLQNDVQSDLQNDIKNSEKNDADHSNQSN